MDEVIGQCPQTTTVLKRKESRSGIKPRSFRLLTWRLTAMPNRLTAFGGVHIPFIYSHARWVTVCESLIFVFINVFWALIDSLMIQTRTCQRRFTLNWTAFSAVLYTCWRVNDYNDYNHPYWRVQYRTALLDLSRGNLSESIIYSLFKELHWLPVKFRIQYKIAAFAYRHSERPLPSYLSASISRL